MSFVSHTWSCLRSATRLAITLPLTPASASKLAIALALPLGIVAAVKADRWYGAAISVISQLGIAIPVFWLGILLVTVFAIDLRLFPSGGFPLDGWSHFGEAFVALVLPVVTVALVIAASLLRYVRSAALDVLGSDYLRTARALGSSFPEALIRHGIRNGAVPVISILGIELATSFLGAVVVEKVYSLPGLGSMLLLAIDQRDYPNVQGVLFVSTLLVLVIGFAADLLQRFVDPRLRGQVRLAMTTLAEIAPIVRRRGSLTLKFGLLLVGLHVAVALLTLVWLPYDPTAMVGGRLESPSLLHWTGTDRLGRDFFTAIMLGSRIALIVGLGAIAIGAAIGVTLGVLAAFATCFLDDAGRGARHPHRLPDAADRHAGGRGQRWREPLVARRSSRSASRSSAVVARLTRILSKRVLVLDYITAARTSGTSWPGIVIQHLLPNIWPTLAVNFALQFGVAIIAEASLSYSGLRRAAAEFVMGAIPAAGGAGHRLCGPGRRRRAGHRAGVAGDRRKPPRRRFARPHRSDAPGRPMTALLRIDRLNLDAAEKPLVSDLSFDIAPGERLKADRRVRFWASRLTARSPPFKAAAQDDPRQRLGDTRRYGGHRRPRPGARSAPWHRCGRRVPGAADRPRSAAPHRPAGRRAATPPRGARRPSVARPCPRPRGDRGTA